MKCASAREHRCGVLEVGDDERVATPYGGVVTSTRNPNSPFACRWLPAPVTIEIAPTRITAKVLSGKGTSTDRPGPGLEVLFPSFCI